MVATFIPWQVVHSISVTMPVVSFFRLSVVFVFSSMPFASRRTSAPASRSTSARRQRGPTSFPLFVPFITVHTSFRSWFLPNVFAVVHFRSCSFFFVPSSGRTLSSFTLYSPFLFLRAFFAALRPTSAEIVGADWNTVTSWSATTSASCSASRRAARTAIDWRTASSASSGGWAEITRWTILRELA